MVLEKVAVDLTKATTRQELRATNTKTPESQVSKETEFERLCRERHERDLLKRGITEEQFQKERADYIANEEKIRLEREAKALAEKKEHIELLVKNINNNLPEGLRHCTFERYAVNKNTQIAFDKAKDFINSNKSLYIYGDVGCGKTHLLYASYQEALKKTYENDGSGRQVRIFNVAKMLHIKREEYQTKEEAELEFVEGLLRGGRDYEGRWRNNPPDYIYFDDMSAENMTARTAEVLYMIFNDVIEYGKTKLFITGNKAIDYISNNISDRVASRIVGLCGKENIIKIVGDDYRLK